mgnify:CR=1 FL=1
MKKIFSIFAIAALATLIFVSCETKNDSSKSASTSEEQVAASDASASEAGKEVAIEDQKELTCNNYTLTVPEGWKASSRMVNSSCNLIYKQNPHTTAMVNNSSYSENDLAEGIKNRGGKPVNDIIVNGKTCKVFENEKDGRYEYEAYVPQGEGFVTFRVMPGGTPMKGAELKEVMMKNLNEIIAATALK